MKERPILFNAPMVRALLDGSKTQTRRIVKDLPPWPITEICHDAGGTGMWMPNGPAPSGVGMAAGHWRECPYGQPGDRLWVRETWADLEHLSNGNFQRQAIYRADGIEQYGDEDEYVDVTAPDMRWRPSIHMPRWASRILLEITSVRVERLQDISEADAVAEGIQRHEYAIGPIGVKADAVRCTHCGKLRRDHVGTAMVCFGGIGTCWNGNTACGGYANLWESIEGSGSWDANPWVWVVEFKRVTP